MSLKVAAESKFPQEYSFKNEIDPEEQRTGCLWQCCSGPMQKLSDYLRGAFYLPLYQEQKVDSPYAIDKMLADKLSSALGHTILENFTVKDVNVYVYGALKRIFTLRQFESNDKKLCVFLFSYYGNMDKPKGSGLRRWEPLSIQDLSHAPLNVLKALKKDQVQVDSLVTTSLGNVVYDALKDPSPYDDDIPMTWVVNRGLTSIEKVSNQLYPYPLSSLLHKAAQQTNWDANPEQGMINFLKRRDQQECEKREVVIVEALKDYYFSEKGAFATNFEVQIGALGVPVSRAKFYPFPLQVRAHHAESLDRLPFNQATKIDSANKDSSAILLRKHETAASWLVREIFLKTVDKCHTCFYVCGNDADLNLGTVRDIKPLLEEYVKEVQELEKLKEAKKLEELVTERITDDEAI